MFFDRRTFHRSYTYVIIQMNFTLVILYHLHCFGYLRCIFFSFNVIVRYKDDKP